MNLRIKVGGLKFLQSKSVSNSKFLNIGDKYHFLICKHTVKIGCIIVLIKLEGLSYQNLANWNNLKPKKHDIK